MATTPQFVNTPNVAVTTFGNSDGTTAKTIFTPGSFGSRVHAISIATNESANRDITLSLVQSSVAYLLGRYTIPSGTSTFPIQVVNGLNTAYLSWLDSDSPSIILPNGTTIQANMEATITSGKKVDIIVLGGDF